MEDQGVDILLMVLFGAGGITLLILAWTMPMAEKIMPISVGTVGLLWVLIRALRYSKK